MAYRYLGNKARLVYWIVETVQLSVPVGARVADPMCGTASVTEALAFSGYKTLAADELTFPVLHARARLLHSSVPKFQCLGGYERVLESLNRLPTRRGYFHREFSNEGTPNNGSRPRAYFTGKNAMHIDAIRSRIKQWNAGGCLTVLEHSLLLHDLIMAVNDVANIAGTYGYYRSSWNGQALRPIGLTPSVFAHVGPGHEVRQGKVELLAAHLDADACYLDPPYTKRQYAGNYHILETLAREDEPEPVGEGGLRDWYDQYSQFCSKRFATAAFNEVIKRLEVDHVFLSYSEDGLIPEQDLHDLLSDRGTVTRYAYPLQRYKSNSTGKSGELSEYLYHLEVS